MDIRVPDNLWDADSEGVISNWLYADGDQVPAEAVIAELMVEKTSYDLVSPAAGKLTILVEEDVPVSTGAVVARID